MAGRRKSRTLTEVELEFMHILWREGEATPTDVMRHLEESGRPLSDGSVRKMLSILVAKGHAQRRQAGRAFLYRATASQQRTQAVLTGDLLSRAFGGSPALLVASLLENRRINSKELARIRELIEQHDRNAD